MIMAIEHSGMFITADAIKAKLMDMEPADMNSDVNNAFACFWKYQSKNTKSMARQKGENPSPQMSKGKPNVKCYQVLWM